MCDACRNYRNSTGDGGDLRMETFLASSAVPRPCDYCGTDTSKHTYVYFIGGKTMCRACYCKPIKCAHCGTQLPSDGYFFRGKNTFCSTKCILAYDDAAKLENKDCLWCGVDTSHCTTAVRDERGTYCDTRCQGAYNTDVVAPPRLNPPHCDHCDSPLGAEFHTTYQGYRYCAVCYSKMEKMRDVMEKDRRLYEKFGEALREAVKTDGGLLASFLDQNKKKEFVSLTPKAIRDAVKEMEKYEMKNSTYLDEPVHGAVRTFDTGATRDSDAGKPDYEGFLSPLVIERYGEYMNKHRVQSDGSLRDSDNWQKGIPITQYMKSGFRHTIQLWTAHRGFTVYDDKTGDPLTIDDILCAVLFNFMGYLHEFLKARLEEKSRD